jgi:hypothetical protein
MVTEAVPVAGLTSNFSPIPPIAPPPLGREIEGKDPVEDDCEVDLVPCLVEMSPDPATFCGPLRSTPASGWTHLGENILLQVSSAECGQTRVELDCLSICQAEPLPKRTTIDTGIL